MKRYIFQIFTLFTLMMLIISGCGQEEPKDPTYTINRQEGVYTVDPVNMTITFQDEVYRYDIQGDAGGHDVKIIFPDGSSCWKHTQTSGQFSASSGGWSEDFVEGKYADKNVLMNIATARAPKSQEDKNILLPMLLLPVGLFNLISPRTGWYLSYGWHYKDAEPSDISLTMGRLGGAFCVILSVILFFV